MLKYLFVQIGVPSLKDRHHDALGTYTTSNLISLMEASLQKDDPLKKPKKIAMGFFVFFMAMLAIVAFASFHWLCSDYFTFKANEAAARDSLDDARNRVAKEEALALERLANITEKAQNVEKKARERANEAEAAAAARIDDAEKKSSNRLALLEEEYSMKKKRLDEEVAAEIKRLDEELEIKKHDIVVLIKGYMERFTERTNDLERAIVGKRNELAEVKRSVELLPDLQRQCEEAEAALAAAKDNRDLTLQKEREAQISFNEWNGKANQAKAECAEERKKLDAIKKEIDSLAVQTNAAVLDLVRLNAELEAVNIIIAQRRAEVERIKGEIEKGRLLKESLKTEIDCAETARSNAIKQREEALAAAEAARENRREAESARDMAVAEREQAEMARDEANRAFERRQVEINELQKSMEELLKKTKGQVESALNDNRRIKTGEDGREEVEE